MGAFAAGLLLALAGETGDERAAGRFLDAWQRKDWPAMHALLTPESKKRASPQELRRAYDRAAATATATGFEAGELKEDDGSVRVPMEVRTIAFGTVRADLRLQVEDEHVRWGSHLAFPGVPEGAELTRVTRAPERAPIQAADGQTIVEGPAQARRTGDVGSSIAGRVGPPPNDAERRDLYARGFPSGALVGLDGLERVLEARVAGTPGGLLLAGGRRLASTEPRAAAPARTTIEPEIQRASVEALGGRFGGIAALDPSSGAVLALAGIAFSAPQPPGSTFKIVTATAALENGLVTPRTSFPVETRAVIDGVELENANGESCGGSFANSFAHSCNSVFAPLGVKLGAKRLVQAAERFGWNAEPTIPGAAKSTIPAAEDMTGPLDVGSSAIGQGRVLATPLLMASVAQTIAADGVRRDPTLVPDQAARGVRVTSAKVAHTVERLMIGVTDYGTGTAANLEPVRVAGKTGTAELEDTTDDEAEPVPGEEAPPPGYDTDAWFTAYAPTRNPKIAVAVLLVRQGAGGETAAPLARLVLQAGLKRGS